MSPRQNPKPEPERSSPKTLRDGAGRPITQPAEPAVLGRRSSR
ncbi:hypothetical protein [Amycolatopsis minnesotensis]